MRGWSRNVRLRASAAGALNGEVRVPGDKSLSHRALMLAAMTVGETRITGLLEGEDVLATASALRGLGVDVERSADGSWRVCGVGVGGLAEPDHVLDLGNAGTGARLLTGLLAGHPFTTFLTGDDSLRKRPMKRVIKPLGEMGASFLARSGDRLPLALTGRSDLIPITYEQPVASAQVKSAVLLAGLHAPGKTTVIEPAPSRDHTERMLRHIGAEVMTEALDDGRSAVTVTGQPELAAVDLPVAGDPSSAAFLMVAAALGEGSALRIDNVGVNPLRTGLFTCLNEMGAVVRTGNGASAAGEPVSWIEVDHGALQAIDVPPERAPSMIDEYPILAVAAACGRGRTRMTGLGELRVKESDRLSAIAKGLEAAGIRVEMGEDSLTIEGCDGPPPGGCTIDAAHDHRIAMSFLILGSVSKEPIEVTGAETIDTSFPGFAELMNRLGARIEKVT
ncbi:MAG: 3-phosphoshikimate 1-carboxyvinyltransferase [Alphaproteobacteria bacterium]|nr:3-phosphoshikimate 1-carboxyvinyltransferase [Alphaproteobacteria bacterium]